MAHRGIQRDKRCVARWGVLFVTCLLLLTGCVMPDGTVYTLPTITPDTSSGEKSVISDRFDVDISVNADGTFDVTEHIGIRFIGGDFSTGFRNIPKQNLDHIDGWGLVDSQGTVYDLATGGNAPYTFVVEDTDEAYDIVWKFPPIADASEIFSLSYTVHDGLRSYEGDDEVWWQAIYGDRSFPVLEGTVRVNVPANSSIREWSAFVNDADASVRARAKAIGEREVVFDLREPLEGGEEFGVRVAFTSDIAGAGVPGQQSVAALADEPSPARPFIDEGDAALDAGDFEAALEAYGQAIEADPNAPYAYYGRALTYDILDDVEAALDDLAYAAALAPADAQIAFLRAEILHYMGEAQGVATVFDKLLAATNDGADLDALDQLQRVLFSIPGAYGPR